jgi:hypothetical protein
MKVKELIKELQELGDDLQDLQVRLVCDHGQTPMKPFDVAEGYVDDLKTYMPEEIHPDDADEDSHKVVVIAG